MRASLYSFLLCSVPVTVNLHASVLLEVNRRLIPRSLPQSEFTEQNEVGVDASRCFCREVIEKQDEAA